MTVDQYVETMFSGRGTALALIFVAVGGLLFFVPLARLFGWSRLPTLIALWGFGGALVVTVANRVTREPITWNWRALNDCVGGISRDWAGAEAILNVLLLVPFAVGLTLASRSFLLTAALVVATSVGIELFQAGTALGTCERGDIVRNIVGGVLAAAITWVVAPPVRPGATGEVTDSRRC